MSRSRGYCFTVNNWSEAEYEAIMNIECVYLVMGKEIGEKCGTPHLQGYIYFKEKKSFAQMKEWIPRANLRVAKGSADSNLTYCGKDKNFIEKGVKPKQGKRNDLIAVRDAIVDGHGSVREGIDNGSIRGYQALRVFTTILPYYEPKRTIKPEVYWIWGESGSGKSELAREICPNAYEKHGDSGKWWDGYDGELDLILDELRGSSFAFTTLLGILLGPCRVEIKGGTRQLQAIKIVITSIYPPELLYNFKDLGDEPLFQLTRRVTNVIFKKRDPYYGLPKSVCPEVGGNTSPDFKMFF